MLEQPEVDIKKANGDLFKIIELCETALRETGKRLNQEKDYELAVDSMKEKISNSKAFIRSLAILGEYCKIL